MFKLLKILCLASIWVALMAWKAVVFFLRLMPDEAQQSSQGWGFIARKNVPRESSGAIWTSDGKVITD